MHIRSIIGLLFGLAITTALIFWLGLESLRAGATKLGPQVIWIPAFFLLPMAFSTICWQYLFPRRFVPPFPLAYYTTWVSLGVNWLLPVAMVGGDIVRIRLLAKRGLDVAVATASAVGDKTLHVASQIGYALLGVGLYLARGADMALVVSALSTMALLSVGAIAFYRVQRGGLFGRSTKVLQRITSAESVAKLHPDAHRIDEALESMYGRRRRMLAACCWQIAFRIIWAGEIWLTLYLLGHPIGFAEAIILESLIQFVRGAAFIVPAGIGTQEASVVILTVALGIPAELGLALALIRRVRELAIGIPALLAWQFDEGRLLLYGQSADND